MGSLNNPPAKAQRREGSSDSPKIYWQFVPRGTKQLRTAKWGLRIFPNGILSNLWICDQAEILSGSVL
jgi:hypothetical protein